MSARRSPDNSFVSTLYAALNRSALPAARLAFDAWKLHWESLHGEIGYKKSAKVDVLAARYGIDAEELDARKLLFAIESYYVLKLRLIAYAALVRARNRTKGELASDAFIAEQPDGLTRRLFGKETFVELGVLNYGGAGLFNWIAGALGEASDALMRRELEGEVLRLVQSDTFDGGDNLRALFHGLVPKEFRHSLGAHYTPDWLADYVLLEVGYGRSDRYSELQSLLDPQCGSGTFLVAALSKAYKIARKEDVDAEQWRDLLENRICGFEIDPVAVIAAKTNLILFACRLSLEGKLRLDQPLRLPVYLCDSISAEIVIDSTDAPLDGQSTRAVKVGAAVYSLPARITQNRESWNEFAGVMLGGIKSDAPFDDVLAELELRSSILFDKDDEKASHGVQSLYSDLRDRAVNGTYEFYAELLMDAVRPALHCDAEVIVGNPPWVNWEYLPRNYKRLIKPLWPRLGLFDARGMNKAFSKEDLSVLATYVACARYLRDGGKLGFLIPQSVFKSSKNSRGFRRFRIGESGPYLKVLKVDDLSETSAFEQATNRAAIIFLRKGQRTTFPVPYVLWKGGAYPKRAERRWRTWDEAAGYFDLTLRKAGPVDPVDPASSWMHGTDAFLSSLNELSGACPYKARTGVFTGGANAVFYLRKIKELKNGNYLVENVTDRARRIVKEVQAVIEPTYVLPFLRGRDVDFWHASVDPNRLILCPHTPETGMRPVEPCELMRTARRTYLYVDMFRDVLVSRGGLTGFDRVSFNVGFYSLLRVGGYTFAPYKVVWRYISGEFKSCVVEPLKNANRVLPVLPQEKLMLIGLHDPLEAYYLCALLSADLVRAAVESRMVRTQISASIIEHLALPIYDPNNPSHQSLARTCRQGHRAKANGLDFKSHLKSINELVPGLLKQRTRSL